jgi:hypothetical protein
VVQLRGGVIQRICKMCKEIGLDYDHSPKKCPLLDAKEEVVAVPKDSKTPKSKFPEKKKEIFHDLGVNLTAVEARPAAGTKLADLANISKAKWPDVYLQTMMKIHELKEAELKITGAKILKFNKGTDKETVEHKVSLSADKFVVIHYHPRATLPKGAALSGESLVHVKGAQAAKYSHKYIAKATLEKLGLPVPEGHT